MKFSLNLFNKIIKHTVILFPETRFISFCFTAFLIAFTICLMLYPGTFSSDSLDQLGQARMHSYATWHPVIMALVMHYLLPVLGIGGIFVLHQFIYWISIALMIDALFKRRIIYFVIGFFPPLFLLTVEIWKDTGMLVCCMLATACVLQYKKRKSFIFLVIGFISILYASCVRSNAFFISSFLFAGSVLVLYKGACTIFKKGCIFFSCLLLIFMIIIFTNNLIKSSYNVKENNPLPSLLLWDIAGISHYSEKYLPLPSYIKITDNNKSSNWVDYYVSDTCSICFGHGFSCDLDKKNKSFDLIKDWLHTIKEEPLAYFRHRIAYIRYLFNIQKSVYYPYQGYSENIKYGENFLPSKIGLIFFNKIEKIGKIVEKVFLYHSFSWIIVVCSILLLEIKKIYKGSKLDFKNQIAIVLCISGISNAFSLTIIGPSADYRYMIWTIFSGLMSIFLLISSSESHRAANSESHRAAKKSSLIISMGV